jgi:DnaJ-class molecular chaperone with C-terminal Zn finger domain
MNIIIYALIILVVSYILLRLIASASAKKISKTLRIVIFIVAILLALLFAFGGRVLFSLPLILLSLGVIKLKGLTLFQLIGLFRLIQTLRNSGRFSFNKNNSNVSTLSVEEAYKILNLNRNNKTTKEDVQKAYLKIQKKIHPDISPETSRLSSIVNEAKEVVLKDLS